MGELILQLSSNMTELISQFTSLEIFYYMILPAIGGGLVTGIFAYIARKW